MTSNIHNVSAHSLFDLLGTFDNLGEPEPFINRSSTILGVVITFMILSWLCVIFRLYTRFKIIYSPGWDDLFVLLSSLSTSLGSVCICLLPKYGMGKHVLLNPAASTTMYLNIFYVANACYCMSTALIKISLLLQYTRVYDRGTALNTASKILAVFSAIWGMAYSIIAWVPCIPVHMFWDRTPTSNATCFGYGSLIPAEFAATYESHSGVNMVLDILILAIPIPIYFKASTRSKSRVALSTLLLMGAIVNFVSIWRLITIVEHRATTYPTFDPTWYGPISIVLAAIEVDASMICACVPVFWPVLDRGFLGNIFVTKEVKITRESLDGFELHAGHSRAGSEASLRGTGGDLERIRSKPGEKGGHYENDYVKGQVDPLRTWKSNATLVETKNGKGTFLS